MDERCFRIRTYTINHRCGFLGKIAERGHNATVWRRRQPYLAVDRAHSLTARGIGSIGRLQSFSGLLSILLCSPSSNLRQVVKNLKIGVTDRSESVKQIAHAFSNIYGGRIHCGGLRPCEH
jgi:hypothetical protein